VNTVIFILMMLVFAVGVSDIIKAIDRNTAAIERACKP